jgi:hypothetical protein
LLNGIDYLEVSADQKTLFVTFIHPLTTPLRQENVIIEGGTRICSLQVESASAFARLLTLRVNQPGDLSTYTLRLVKSINDRTSPPGYDSQLSQIDFLFRVTELSEFDCEPSPKLADKPPAPPAIDYLAKDYASFRQLMLDRLAVTMPKWQERNPSDLGVMLVELVAYAADHLSYYQDAAATEAYLGTARKRVSVRRHARLLNYGMHDGCNARTWIALQVSAAANGQILQGATSDRPGTRCLTKGQDLPLILTDDVFRQAVESGVQVFETLHDLMLHQVCNEIQFYTWGDEQCSLPAGATHVTLVDRNGALAQHWLPLRPGKPIFLLFEEVIGPISGRPQDADPTRRHVVRLTNVTQTVDPLFNVNVLEVEWGLEDALPFPLVISTLVNQYPVANLTVARGNVVLADHGCSLDPEVLPEIDDPDLRYRPRLQNGPLTQQGMVQTATGTKLVFDPTGSAAAALRWEIQVAQPAITLQEITASGASDPALRWRPQRDLLNSDRFARDFAVETEEDGRAYLRFGDGISGKRPPSDTLLTATYRIGNGRAGNIGADAIAHLYSPTQTLHPWFLSPISPSPHLPIPPSLHPPISPHPIRNPLPARGGTDPESLTQVRLYAPQAFRTQQRAVTEADYAEITQRFPGVRKALATRRWTGSWYTIFITVDRSGGLPLDQDFKEKLSQFLERYRLTGHDLELESPRLVPLAIALKITVAPNYFRSQVKAALQLAFSNQVLPDGRLAFFHPDNFTFGQPVYLSQVIAAALQVVGVQSVEATQFQRRGPVSRTALEAGQISFDRLEIALLNNDPTAPEEGEIKFDMEGGR